MPEMVLSAMRSMSPLDSRGPHKKGVDLIEAGSVQK
jgi:hypothetical protein